MASAGRDRGTLRFELDALRRHLHAYLTALRCFLGTGPALRVRLTNLGPPDRAALLEEHLLAPLRAEFPGIDCGWNDSRATGRGYYRSVCVHLAALAPTGEWVNLVDGGAVDWTARLLSDAKERLVISGIGSDRVCTVFGQQDTASPADRA